MKGQIPEAGGVDECAAWLATALRQLREDGDQHRVARFQNEPAARLGGEFSSAQHRVLPESGRARRDRARAQCAARLRPEQLRLLCDRRRAAARDAAGARSSSLRHAGIFEGTSADAARGFGERTGAGDARRHFPEAGAKRGLAAAADVARSSAPLSPASRNRPCPRPRGFSGTKARRSS